MLQLFNWPKTPGLKMKLISIDSITTSKEVAENLINNNNTGVEFEYALFYLLSTDSNRSIFLKNIIYRHKLKDKIIHIFNNSKFEKLKTTLADSSWAKFNVFLATQCDEIGPADVVLKNSNNDCLGLSVKNQNNCSLNITGRSFLTNSSLNLLEKELTAACSNYIAEMRNKYVTVDKWFKTRKRSKETDFFIDKIRDCVISDWNKKNVIEKTTIVDKFTHANSPINYWIVKYLKPKNNIYGMEINKNPIKQNLSPQHITLTKKMTSYIIFNYQGVQFAQMQVKFNNGILDNPTQNGGHDFLIEDKIIKKGDPFSSWNVST